MIEINSETTRVELAAVVVDKLRQHKIDAVLVGGAVVSIYTNNRYQSDDLDFVAPAGDDRIRKAMGELGFVQKGRHFHHPNTHFTVEFPGRRVAIGDDDPVTPDGLITVHGIDVVLLSPTQSVMDRLAWYFFNNDTQCFAQALWITQSQPIDLAQVREWAIRERQQEKFDEFLSATRANSL